MKKSSKKAKSEQRKFHKSYSLTTRAVHAIALAAKMDSRNPSDFLELHIIDNFGHLVPEKK